MKNEHKNTEVGTWNDRLEMLGYDIVALISHGKKESVNEIIRHFEESNVVRYLMKKYEKEMFIVYEGCPYNFNDWEKVLGQYSYMTFGHDVNRKMGIINEETDGLLMLLNIILDEVSSRKYK
jgi:hypothetical protein